MTTELVLGLFGVLLSAVTAAYAGWRVRLKHDAEEALLRTLWRDNHFMKLLREHRNLLVHAQKQTLSPEELLIVTRYLEESIQQLQERDRRPVREAIEQPSLRGRANYVSKLLSEVPEGPQTMVPVR